MVRVHPGQFVIAGGQKVVSARTPQGGHFPHYLLRTFDMFWIFGFYPEIRRLPWADSDRVLNCIRIRVKQTRYFKWLLYGCNLLVLLIFASIFIPILLPGADDWFSSFFIVVIGLGIRGLIGIKCHIMIRNSLRQELR